MYQKSILDNGLRVVTSTMPHTRAVCISIFIGVGSRYETDSQAGVSHFIEHMYFRGTAKRASSREISAAIEGVGGIMNGATNKELSAFWCKMAQHHFPLALDVLVDMLLHSKFDPADLEKERQVIIDEIHMSKDQPSQRVEIIMDELLWPNHPLGRDTAGSRESVAALTRDTMLDYLQSHYQPSNTVIAIAGNIQHPEIVTAVSHTLGNWTNQQPASQYTPYKEQPAPRLRIETRPIEQANLCLGLPGLSLFHPKRFALDLLNVILGEGMSSRLFTEIRDRLGLAYTIHSYTEHFLDSGSLSIYAGVEPKNLPVAIKAILEQVARLTETIPEAELSKAKEQAKGRLLLRMEDSHSVAGWLGGQELLTGRILTIDEVMSLVDAITVEELEQLARELLVGSKLRLAVVGPLSADEPLERLLKLS